MGHEHGHVHIAAERDVPREALVEHARKRVLVRPTVDLAALEQLGGHVAQRAEDGADPGDLRARVDRTDEPEVGQEHLLGRPPRGRSPEQDVVWLHVAVDQTVGMGLVEGTGDLVEDRQGAVGLESAGQAKDRRQAGALDVAHREVQLATHLTRVVDLDDVRVAERGRETCFAQEPLTECLVLGDLRGDDLQRDTSLQRRVFGGIDDAHPSTPDEGLDDVSAELVANREGRAHSRSLDPPRWSSVADRSGGPEIRKSDGAAADRLVRKAHLRMPLALVHAELVIEAREVLADRRFADQERIGDLPCRRRRREHVSCEQWSTQGDEHVPLARRKAGRRHDPFGRRP